MDNFIDQKNSHNYSVMSILVLSGLFLVSAHLAVKEFFPNPIFWIIGAFITLAVALGWIILKKRYFEFLMAIFVCVHFNFAYKQGGFWAYVLCSTVAIGIFFYRPEINLSSVPKIFTVFIVIIFIEQILGTVLNPYSIVNNIQATVVSMSHLLAFYLFASQKMRKEKLKCFLSVWFFVICWVFFMGLNQRYQWIISTSPFVPQREYQEGVFAHLPGGSFGNGELFGEYFCIVLAFSMVILGHLKDLEPLKIKKSFSILAVLIALAGILIGHARSAVILAALVISYVIIFDFFAAPSASTIRRSIIVSCTLGASFILLYFISSLIFIDKMAADFKTLDTSKLSVVSVVSGRGINRGDLFITGWRRIKQGSWWTGYGYNLPDNNRKSMGFYKSGTKDYHSLYLSLPFFYGWFGAIAYILLILGTGLRVYLRYIFADKKNMYFITPIALGFAILWGVFIIDQYKIGATRNPNYYLLTWIWLGLTHSIANGMTLSINKEFES